MQRSAIESRKKIALLISLLVSLPTPIYPKRIKPPTTISPEHATISAALALGTCIAIIVFNKYLHKKSSKLRKATALAASFLGAYAFILFYKQYGPIFTPIEPHSHNKLKRPLFRRRKERRRNNCFAYFKEMDD